MYKTITKEFNFDSSHRLINPNLTKTQNINIYGKCYNFPSHGHNYILQITVSGLESNGMIVNFSQLKEVVNKSIIEPFDHHFLNDLEFFKNKVTTIENIITTIWNILEEEFKRLNTKKEFVILEKIKLYETPTCWCELENINYKI